VLQLSSSKINKRYSLLDSQCFQRRPLDTLLFQDNGANQATNDQTKFSLQLKSILDSKCEGIPVNLHCLGVEGSEEQLMACHDDGRLTCSDLNTFYRPTQFIIRLHTDTNSGTTPIVSILSLGMGPSDTFFVAFTENTFAVVVRV
jgi:hypothetical protein